MSLDFDNAETPEEAFWRKLPEEKIFEYEGWFVCDLSQTEVFSRRRPLFEM